MKRLLHVIALTAILTTSLFAATMDPAKALSVDTKSTRPLVNESRYAPTFEFSTAPVSFGDNYYDYFPGSYTSLPMQRVDNSADGGINGNWIVYHTKTTAGGNRRVYKAFIDGTGSLVTNTAFGTNDIGEGYPSIAVTAGGRPIFAYHVNLDDDAALEVGMGYDALLGGSVMEMHSSLQAVIENFTSLEVNGEVFDSNQFLWASTQIADSPVAGSQRIYIMGKNATTNGSAVAENVYIVFKDFTEADIENQVFDNTGWLSTTIPTLDEWNVSQDEWRRPFMSFVAKDDKIYYVGYHIASTESGDAGEPIDEPTTDVFVCDNYGEGTWETYSIYSGFNVDNPNYINPTGDHEGTEMEKEYFTDQTDEDLYVGIGQSSHFNVSFDNLGRIHIPAFYTVKSGSSYYSSFHTVKNIIFDTHTSEWLVSEVYPQSPNPLIDITDSSAGISDAPVWLWWDTDGDGQVDEIADDGTYDGVDDGVTADAEEWGQPLSNTIWPFQYWNEEAADNAMMFHLQMAHITEANDAGMMAMVWHDSQKSRSYNKYPDSYPELADHAQMSDIVISVSQDNGNSWSEPITLNGVDTAEMLNNIPQFAYPGNKMDYIGENEDGYQVGRLYLMYLDDETYGSSVQDIGQATGGTMKYASIDVTFTQTPNASGNVASTISMLNQNYPNPFNPETTISYNVAKSGKVNLDVYNMKGQLVKSLVNGSAKAGNHQVVWKGTDNSGNKVSTGVYFYKISNGGKNETKKMVLMK